jgi:hypothetical protein
LIALLGCILKTPNQGFIPFRAVFIAGQPSEEFRYQLTLTIPIFTSEIAEHNIYVVMDIVFTNSTNLAA